MIEYAFYTELGEYIQTGITMTELTAIDIPEDCQVYYGRVNLKTQYHDTNINQPRDMEPKPGENYKFDYGDKVWRSDPVYAANEALAQRQRLLAESDWTDTVSAQARLGDQYQVWQTYRQALRDITSQPGYPISIEWPHVPQ